MSDKDKMLERRINQIENYLNKEICERLKNLDSDTGTLKKLKSDVMHIALIIFHEYARRYQNVNSDRYEYVIVNGYRGIDELSKFNIEIKIGEKYISFDIENPKLKKTENKIGKFFIYELTDKSFDLSKIHLTCYKYLPFLNKKHYISFQFNQNLTVRENFQFM